ncbi:hypothetical protein AZI85_00350 [Bdellovibrio bacteriovorus]|uniref:Peptidase S1 domain-containing protein n=1 Tax=Bdellovibrio bacteriovorus TaxID=959 RepID=A0A150WV72_BDEBC|nr:trypsin-like serine protease [Bdellovibrio bacteriovorus]KYG70440.1 hypothetical protein AZI85_00350 [Bdellovibrio bacteriovorus]
MRKWLVLPFLLSACQSDVQTSPAEITQVDSPAIVGGTEVAREDAMTRKALHLRSLYNKQVKDDGNKITTSYKVQECTAAAISPRIILTAAHCIVENANVVRIELPIEDKKALFNVIKIVRHPDYPKEDTADLAMMLLEISLPEDVTIMTLPEAKKSLELKNVTAAGFGRTNGKKSLPGNAGILRTANLEITSYDPNLPTFEVDQTKGKGVCQGDSGGPAMLTAGEDTMVVGVVSKSLIPQTEDPDPDWCNYRGQYINVQYHMDWIQKTLNALSLE